MEMSMDSGAEDDNRSRNLDFDRASVKSLEETQQSWLLEPAAQKKQKQIDLGCMVCSRKLFLIIFGTLLAASAIVGLSIVIWKFAPRKHHHPAPLDNYTIALKMALRFFDAQKCKTCAPQHHPPGVADRRHIRYSWLPTVPTLCPLVRVFLQPGSYLKSTNTLDT